MTIGVAMYGQYWRKCESRVGILGSASWTRDDRRSDVTFDECSLRCTVCEANWGQRYWIDPRGVNSTLHWVAVEVIVSIGGLVILAGVTVGK